MKLLLIAAASLALPSVHAAGGYDMSATFKALKTCSECTAAGYGWCPLRRMCGGFAVSSGLSTTHLHTIHPETAISTCE